MLATSLLKKLQHVGHIQIVLWVSGVTCHYTAPGHVMEILNYPAQQLVLDL